MTTDAKSATNDARPLALAFLPLIVLIALVLAFSHNMPMSDDWDLVPLLQKQSEHTLQFEDLWAPYAEHRIFFGRALMLLLAGVTHWNLPIQCAVNVAFSALTMLAIALLLKHYRAELGLARRWTLLLPGCVVIVLSVNGWLNYLWAWQCTLLLSVCTLVWGTALLSRVTPLRWITAALLGVGASCSFANGIFFWLLAPLVLLLGRPLEKKRIAAAGALLVVGVIVTYLVMQGIPAHAGALGEIIHNPIGWVVYVFTFLGNVLAPPGHYLAFAFGVAGVALLAALILLCFRQRTPAQVQFAALGLYAVLNACSIAAGRMHLGYLQGSDPRYYPLAMPLWIANLVLLDRVAHRYAGSKRLVTLARAAGVAIVILSLVRAIPQWQNIHAYEQRQLAARAALLSGENESALVPIATERVPVDEIKARDQVLRTLSLSLHHP